MPSKKHYPRTGELSYVQVGRRGRHKLVPVTVKPKPAPMKIPNDSNPVIITSPQFESDNNHQNLDFEIPESRNRSGKVSIPHSLPLSTF